jgi:hypothetical protein
VLDSAPMYRAVRPLPSLTATAGPSQGLVVVEEAIRMVGTERPFYYLPELHRIRGDLLAGNGRPEEASTAYRRAMALAAGHGTRSAELRASLRTCRLPEQFPLMGSRQAKGLSRLRRLYDQFEEGFGTPDLRAAEALLRAG